MNPPPIDPQFSTAVPPVMKRRLHWPLFIVALLLPPVLTLLTAHAGWQNFPVACPFIGGGAAGIVCGILLGRRLGRTTQAVVILSIVFSLVFAAVCFALCFGGCLLGNYNLNIH
jgi:hypothetical protein